MALKGGVHLLGNRDNPINILKMHFDGHEHYRRHIDPDRIVGRLYGLRDYCSIVQSDDIIDDGTANHIRMDPKYYSDCQLLQLVDLMIGGFRTILHRPTRPIHTQLAAPIRAIVDRYQDTPDAERRWCNSFCISQCQTKGAGGSEIQYEQKAHLRLFNDRPL
jgi:hypothetical protein